jgi:hypothetical protein
VTIGRALLRRTVPAPSGGPSAAEGHPGGRRVLPLAVRKGLHYNGIRLVVGLAGDLPLYANHSLRQTLPAFIHTEVPVPRHVGAGAGSHTLSKTSRHDEGRTTTSRADPIRRGGSGRRPSTDSRPGRPPRRRGPDTASRHPQSRPARTDHQASANTAVPQPLPNTALDTAGWLSPTMLWRSAIRQHLYVTAAMVDSSPRPSDHTPPTPGSSDVRHASDLQGCPPTPPPRHVSAAMADTAHP